MFMKSCACGETKKNFKFDIGEFFVAECCLKHGYDEYGKRLDGESPVEPEGAGDSSPESSSEAPKEGGEGSDEAPVGGDDAPVAGGSESSEESSEGDKSELDKGMALDKMSFKELQAKAEKMGIDHSKEKSKKGIIALIQKPSDEG